MAEERGSLSPAVIRSAPPETPFVTAKGVSHIQLT